MGPRWGRGECVGAKRLGTCQHRPWALKATPRSSPVGNGDPVPDIPSFCSLLDSLLRQHTGPKESWSCEEQELRALPLRAVWPRASWLPWVPVHYSCVGPQIVRELSGRVFESSWNTQAPSVSVTPDDTGQPSARPCPLCPPLMSLTS